VCGVGVYLRVAGWGGKLTHATRTAHLEEWRE
jgi:hypothetical protein